MSIFNSRKSLPICTLLALLLLAGNPVYGQNCACAPNECCSMYNYCGTDPSYCGPGCKSGPCLAPSGNNWFKVADVVTDAFFDGIASQSPESCPGKRFYTRSIFLQALESYGGFGTAGSIDDSKREIAAFFAHVTRENGHMYDIEEKTPTQDYCDKSKLEWPCAPNKGYYGRGPLQLTWNYNYGSAGQSLQFDGLNDPDILARD